MRYNYKKGTTERDLVVVTLLYITIACLLITGGAVIRAYTLELKAKKCEGYHDYRRVLPDQSWNTTS